MSPNKKKLVLCIFTTVLVQGKYIIRKSLPLRFLACRIVLRISWVGLIDETEIRGNLYGGTVSIFSRLTSELIRGKFICLLRGCWK